MDGVWGKRGRNIFQQGYVYQGDLVSNAQQLEQQDTLRAADHANRAEGKEGESLHTKSDEVLISLFQNGEQEAFRLLVDRHREKVRNLIYSIFNEPDIVDDLTQEVFIKAYEGLSRFRFQSSFYTWVYRIAVNRSRDELRKRKIRKWLSLEATDRDLQEATTVHPESIDEREIVARGLESLPEKFRIAVILKDIEGLSYEQMAEVMQCEIGTVKSRLSRGRAMLRRVVAPLLRES